MIGLEPKNVIKSIFKVGTTRIKIEPFMIRPNRLLHIMYKPQLNFYIEVLRMFTNKADILFNASGGFVSNAGK